MSKRLTYSQVERFVDVYSTEGLVKCCAEFNMTPFEAAKEASLLNIQEPCEFTQREKLMMDRYQKVIGTGMIFLLTDRRPEDFTSAVNA